MADPFTDIEYAVLRYAQGNDEGQLANCKARVTALLKAAEVLSDVDPVVLAAWKLQGRKVGAMLREAQGAVIELQETLRQIGDFAHDESTGPAVPDALWEVRSMAYDALRADGAPEPAHQSERQQTPMDGVEAEYASWFPIAPACSVCDAAGAKYRPIMSREHPVCDRCYGAWYEGAGTDRASIRAALGLPADPPEAG